MEQLEDLIAGADVRLSDEILDRIDKIVPPGTTLNRADDGWEAPELQQTWRRRRPEHLRAAN